MANDYSEKALREKYGRAVDLTFSGTIPVDCVDLANMLDAIGFGETDAEKVASLTAENATLRARLEAAELASGFRTAARDEDTLAEHLDAVAKGLETATVESLAAHYACAMANWTTALDERDTARAEADSWRKRAEAAAVLCEAADRWELVMSDGDADDDELAATHDAILSAVRMWRLTRPDEPREGPRNTKAPTTR